MAVGFNAALEDWVGRASISDADRQRLLSASAEQQRLWEDLGIRPPAKRRATPAAPAAGTVASDDGAAAPVAAAAAAADTVAAGNGATAPAGAAAAAAEAQEPMSPSAAHRDTVDGWTVRPYTMEDKEAVDAVCLQTGDAGQDATAQYPNAPRLLGARWVQPYGYGRGTVAFVLEDSEGVCGYVLAAIDSRQFYGWLCNDYAPVALQRFGPPIRAPIDDPTPQEQALLAELASPKYYLTDELQQEYPSHLHIDLCPRAQGQGQGQRLMERLLGELRSQGSRGVHLEMHRDNKRALGFYTKKFGFEVIPGPTGPDTPLYLGLRL
eukprot:TRINITY_DN6681_c4_g1_i1.p1 TRINITY_DN6681_c4_g1~~TRINITY_DN6681_c4_g1_i1.p1  ORF type:complete len:342 (+),score=100.94 TRINITY_DN6681_c4_g1_i1:58-1026(+)